MGTGFRMRAAVDAVPEALLIHQERNFGVNEPLRDFVECGWVHVRLVALPAGPNWTARIGWRTG